MDKHGKLPQPAGPGERRSAWLSLGLPTPASGQGDSDQKKGVAAPQAPPQGNLAAEGHHLPNSQQSPHKEWGAPFPMTP